MIKLKLKLKLNGKFLWRWNRLKDTERNSWQKWGHVLKNMVWEKVYYLQRDRLERELFHSCILLKNLAIVHRELPLSTDFILEQLMEASKPLHTTYADVLTLYRKGEKEAAFQCIYQRIPTRTTLDFIRILSKLDDLLPAELIMQMEGFESTFSAERKTKAMARAERKSLITTLASTATIFTVLLNFTVVVIFLDTLRVLSQLF